jgi:hypothetical protein
MKSVLFNILDFLRYCDKRDMEKGLVCRIWILRVWMARSNDQREMDYPRYK